MSHDQWEIPEKAIEGLVIVYWHHYYERGACTLCGNSGMIDTTGVCTPAGLPVGRKNYCICPNGITMRKMHAKEQ